MSSSVSKPSNKTIIKIVTIAALGALAGSAITYALTQSLPVGEDNTKQTRATESGPPETVLPEGTISPNDAVKDLQKYKGKEIKVRGMIVETAPDKYSLVSQDQENPGALILDTSKSQTGPKEFISGYVDQSRRDPSKPPVEAATVTGTLVIDASGTRLVVQNIEK